VSDCHRLAPVRHGLRLGGLPPMAKQKRRHKSSIPCGFFPEI
jgi:hypothetical protein